MMNLPPIVYLFEEYLVAREFLDSAEKPKFTRKSEELTCTKLRTKSIAGMRCHQWQQIVDY